MATPSSKIQSFYRLRTATNRAEYLLPHVKPDMHILDVGCGPGSITADFARYVPQGSVTAVDFSETMLKAARELATSTGGRAAKIVFYQADAMDLSRFEDDTFDVVHAHQVVGHFTDPVRALKEMRRVLKPGGVLASRDVMSQVWYPSNEVIDRTYGQSNDDRNRESSTREAGKKLHIWAHEAGFPFDRIEIRAGSWSHTGDESKLWAERAGTGRSSEGIDQSDEAVREAREIQDAWKWWGEQEGAWLAGMDGCMLAWK